MVEGPHLWNLYDDYIYHRVVSQLLNGQEINSAVLDPALDYHESRGNFLEAAALACYKGDFWREIRNSISGRLYWQALEAAFHPSSPHPELAISIYEEGEHYYQQQMRDAALSCDDGLIRALEDAARLNHIMGLEGKAETYANRAGHARYLVRELNKGLTDGFAMGVGFSVKTLDLITSSLAGLAMPIPNSY